MREPAGPAEPAGTGPEGPEAGDPRAARIREARLRGQPWVVVEEHQERDGFRRVEMHVWAGVAVEYGCLRDPEGRPVYYTESRFLNRDTGRELPCGSRRWNVLRVGSRAELEEAVRRAKEDAEARFAGLIRAAQRAWEAARQAREGKTG